MNLPIWKNVIFNNFLVYHLKVSKKSNRSTCQIYSKLTKDTRTTSSASFVNFEHILQFILLLILLNLNKQMLVGPEEWWFQTIFFSNFEKYISLSWKNLLGYCICFHLYSLNIRLWKDKFSQQHFQIISQTLHLIFVSFYLLHSFTETSYEMYLQASRERN